MHTLIIGSRRLRNDFEELSRVSPVAKAGITKSTKKSVKDKVQHEPSVIDWEYDFNEAMAQLTELDVDNVVLDTRFLEGDRLGALLSNLSLTTRVLAIVDELPNGELYCASGVVYLTPPVKVADINWFIHSQEQSKPPA